MPGWPTTSGASGFTIDSSRLRYFRVLAQFRATIGTLAGLRTRDRRGEIAWQLMYNTLHTRLLAEVLADAEGVALPPPLPVPDDDGPNSWVYDVALGDLRDVVLPALDRGFAATRAKSVARLLKYLREAERLGPEFAAAGARRDRRAARATVRRRRGRAAGRLRRRSSRVRSTAAAVLPYCLRQAARDTALMRSGMGALADRHLTPVRERQEDTTP